MPAGPEGWMLLVLSRERGVQGRMICESRHPGPDQDSILADSVVESNVPRAQADLVVSLHHHDRKWYPTCLHRKVFVDHQNPSTRLPSKPNPLSQCFQLPRLFLDLLGKQLPTTAWVFPHLVAIPRSSFRRPTPADREVRKSTRGDLG